MCTDDVALAMSSSMSGKKLLPSTWTSAELAVLSAKTSASSRRSTRSVDASRRASARTASSVTGLGMRIGRFVRATSALPDHVEDDREQGDRDDRDEGLGRVAQGV